MRMRTWDWEAVAIYIGCLALNLLAVWYVVFQIRLFQIDAMARTLNAWSVFFSTQPKLSNMGFVWLPLPTFLQLPLILIPPLRNHGLAGNVLAALVGAGVATLLYSLMRYHGLRRWQRLPLLGAWVLNPMVLLYSSNAMSEIISIFCLVLAWHQFDRWVDNDETMHLVWIALAMAMWFLTRYESLFFAAALAALIAAHLWQNRRPLAHIWAAELLYGAPIAGTMAIWMAVNWAIMGHPLYFAVGAYSTGAEAPLMLAADSTLVPLRTAPLDALRLIVSRSGQLYPAVALGILAVLALGCLRRRWMLAGYVFFPIAFLGSSLYNFLYGFPLLSLRYFILAIPLGALLLIEATRSFRARGALAVASILTFGAMAGSIPFTAQAMLNSQKGIEDNYAMSAFLGRPTPDLWADDRRVAQYILDHAGYREVLSDTRGGSNVIFFAGRFDRFVVPSDSDFKRILAAPYGQVQYILAIEMNPEQSLDQILETYPELASEDDAGWARLVIRGYPFRLYEIVASPYASSVEGSGLKSVIAPPASTP